jgi:subtilisin-like proprotein convertase family protein
MKRLRVFLLVLLAVASTALVQAQTTESFTFTTNRFVPDGTASGLSDVQNVTSAIGNIASVKVRLKVNGEFNGDMYGYLRHSDGFTILLNRPGKSVANPFGYGDSGFDITFQDAAPNGDLHLYQAVTNVPDGSPLTGIWQPDGRNVDPALVTDASLRSTSLTNFSGLGAAGEWTLYLVDMESGATNILTEWGLDITGGASPTLVWPTPADIVYGTALSGSQLNASVTYNSVTVPGSFAYTPVASTVLNAGSNQTLTVVFTPTDTSSYLPITNHVAINVLKAPLTITANNTNKLYGAAVPTLTASYLGFVNGDTEAKLQTPVVLNTAATPLSHVGNFTITATGASDTNYDITHVNGTLTVTPAPLTITADSTNKVYGAALPIFTASYGGFVNGDTAASLTTPPTITTTATAASPVATYPITAANAVDADYAITYVDGTLTVTRGTVTVTAQNATKAFGQALPAFTANYTGFALGQDTNSLTTLATITTAATATSDVGTYPITASGAASPNYSFLYVNASLTITQSLSSGVVTTSANPAPAGSSVTFTATLSAVAPGAGAPNGTVNFRIDGTVAGSGTLSGGVATFTTSTLAHGSHTVAAEYAGSLNFVGTTNSLAQHQVINSAPIAHGKTIERFANASVKVRTSELLANDTDADGDTLAITVSPTSANGGTIVVSGGWAIYTPAAAFTSADSFTYTIDDGNGGTATATVTVDVKVDNGLSSNLSITSLGNHQYRIDGSGIPGRTYRIQYSDTANPLNWQDLLSVTADSLGRFGATDTSSGDLRFYRSVTP